MSLNVRLDGVICRDKMATYENRLSLEHEERQRELAQKVMAATLDQLRSQIQSDMKLLEEQLPTKQMAAMETALDMKYVKDRQKSFAWIKSWIAFNPKCQLDTFNFFYL